MKLKLAVLAALLLVFHACVSVDYKLGANLLPGEQNYTVDTVSIYLDEIMLSVADSLSGFDDNHIVVGAIKNAEGRVSARSCALTLVPLQDTMDFGKNPRLNNFHLAIATDTVSLKNSADRSLLQSINVYELNKPINPNKDFNCNAPLAHSSQKICIGTPIVNGVDSLSFDFTEDYAKKFFTLTKEEQKDWKKYKEKIPGIYIDSEKPIREGGRINLFQTQLTFDKSYGLVGNFAQLNFNAEYKGERKDTSFFFYLGAQEFVNVDSLLTNTASGVNYPQYALNFTDEEDFRQESAGEKMRLCGGGGVKPRIKASYLKRLVNDAISKKGGDPKEALINKATIILPFEMTDNRDDMYLIPRIISPSTKIKTDTTCTFMSLTDNSVTTENIGIINRAYKRFEPDISYHIQSIIRQSDEKLASGSYDVWFLFMRYNTKVTDTSDSEMAEMYEMLAYQSYYNQMYGGGGGSVGYNGYSNYYSYMMMAQYAASSTSTSTVLGLDRDYFYEGYLYGPACADTNKRPRLVLTYSVPKKTK